MTTLSTHDTKRGEDVRARITALAELPYVWDVDAGPAAGAGAAPGSRLRVAALAGRRRRLAGLPRSACTGTPRRRCARPATGPPGTPPTWPTRTRCTPPSTRPSTTRPCARCSTASSSRSPAPAGSNALAAKLVSITMPGVPDVYQGSELWEQSLVDPDNRRFVDFDLRARAARRARRRVRRTAHGRRRRPGPPQAAGHPPRAPPPARPARAVHDVRRADGDRARRPTTCSRSTAAARSRSSPGCRSASAVRGGWEDTRLDLPDGTWRDVLSDRTFESDRRP